MSTLTVPAAHKIPALKISEPTPTLRDLARDACEQHKSPRDARASILRLLENEPHLRESLLANLIDIAVGEIVYARRHINLSAVKYPPRPSNRAAGIVAVSATLVESLLDGWDFHGVKLGDLLGAELAAFVEAEKGSMEGVRRRVVFLEKLSAIVPADKHVREVVGEGKARKLWKSVCGE